MISGKRTPHPAEHEASSTVSPPEPDAVVLRLTGTGVTIEDVVALAKGKLRIELGDQLRQRLNQGTAHLQRHLDEERRIYGVTTGFGERCSNLIDSALAPQVARNLVAFHGAGTGRILDDRETRAVVAVRLASLARGLSAVRPVVVQRLCDLLNHGIHPVIPAEGSVGASGDLTPLSYVAAALMGDREVRVNGTVLPASEALLDAGLEPIEIGPKESLALMNGTSAMTGLACLAIERAEELVRLSTRLTATASDVMKGNRAHFDARIFAAKPHPGQQAVAAGLREALEYNHNEHQDPPHLQDRYSLRCAPHVIGVLADALPFVKQFVETEVNSANDNPLIDPETGDVLHGGNFYGGHIAFAMDSMKNAVANVADLLDRQLELLVNPTTNNGLPANLIVEDGNPEHDRSAVTHHGFKAMQITASALTAEALKLTMPASVFSRSTESHNQDKVSMGTISARDCLRVLELTETVVAIHWLALAQAVDLRDGDVTPASLEMRDRVRKLVPMNTADRRQDNDIQAVLRLIRTLR